ncbi:hypothetical protein FC19_GL000241 [Liquorilactobacillus aquaticus DSM 21051]|uniref:Uncharacterized protein n=1 Tax=Liquorilactobacillus aquaticus DSM 21051 TaxID=1423725 RepID=A0A0R2CZ03_9LACO|nr:hypothetical protein [Liquorilactobacillus aquaticus]KRM96725.1 hypothetical protein FC19_GL000241 [Liquorilactobacillus aquaticus DSM 21051]
MAFSKLQLDVSVSVKGGKVQGNSECARSHCADHESFFIAVRGIGGKPAINLNAGKNMAGNYCRWKFLECCSESELT